MNVSEGKRRKEFTSIRLLAFITPGLGCNNTPASDLNFKLTPQETIALKLSGKMENFSCDLFIYFIFVCYFTVPDCSVFADKLKAVFVNVVLTLDECGQDSSAVSSPSGGRRQ